MDSELSGSKHSADMLVIINLQFMLNLQNSLFLFRVYTVFPVLCMI